METFIPSWKSKELHFQFSIWIHFREQARYCYENQESGCVQYEYPDDTNQNQNACDDDEMDICTTPPPPSIIDEPASVVESRTFGKNLSIYQYLQMLTIFIKFLPAPEPPNWSSAKAALIKKHKSTVRHFRIDHTWLCRINKSIFNK